MGPLYSQEVNQKARGGGEENTNYKRGKVGGKILKMKFKEMLVSQKMKI